MTDLLDLASSLADRASGTELIDVMMGRSRSTSVRAYDGAVEAFTSAESFGVGIRVIDGGRLGFAHAGSLDPDVLDATLAEARDNVPFSEPDEYVGLADPDGVEAVSHDHWNQAVVDLEASSKIERALELERLAVSKDERITGVRVAAWGDASGEMAYAASNGIRFSDRGTSCSAGVQPMASEHDETQIGYAGDAARDPDLIDLDEIATEAADKATRLLGAIQPPSGRLPIVFEPKLTATLLSIVSGMLDGESVLKGRSPFADRVGEQIASPLLHLVDDPTRSESLAAETWDGEGLACRPNELITDGVLHGFLQNSYSGRRSGLQSTGSAIRGARGLPGVGAQVLVLRPGERSFDELVGALDHALFVNSLTGLHSGVNPVSGDFSVGADGLMIRDGSLAEPVREITIASTLQRLLLDIVEVGGDAEWLPSGDHTASVVIGDVAMSGV